MAQDKQQGDNASSFKQTFKSNTLPYGKDKAIAVRSMFDTIAPRYDLLNRILTFGQDIPWRKKSLRALGLPKNSMVIDLASGTGDLSMLMSKNNLTPIGVDLSWGMLKHNRSKASLVQSDASLLPFRSESIDGVISGFALRNFANLDLVFDEISRVLRPGGRFALLEVSVPSNPFLKLGHSFYFNKVVPAVGGALSDSTAYKYLPRSVEYLPSADELIHSLSQKGFIKLGHVNLSFGIAQLFIGEKG